MSKIICIKLPAFLRPVFRLFCRRKKKTEHGIVFAQTNDGNEKGADADRREL